MSTELSWNPSFSASCFHAAEAFCRGRPLTDQQLAAAIAGPAEQLQREIIAADLPEARFWGHLIGLAATVESNRQLAETAVVKTLGGRSAVQDKAVRLEGRVADVEAVVRHEFPRMADRLANRGGPLREQWEARGPGLLQSIARLTDERVLPARAQVVLVHPALGGAGRAHLPYNGVRIEAVLAHPVAELPETLRLGWLLGQLNLDLPFFGERIHMDRLPWIAELAMIPATLDAAERVELARCDPPTIALALKTWDVAVSQDADLAETLVTWWETHRQSQSRWDVSLTALDRMID